MNKRWWNVNSFEKNEKKESWIPQRTHACSGGDPSKCPASKKTHSLYEKFCSSNSHIKRPNKWMHKNKSKRKMQRCKQCNGKRRRQQCSTDLPTAPDFQDVLDVPEKCLDVPFSRNIYYFVLQIKGVYYVILLIIAHSFRR